MSSNGLKTIFWGRPAWDFLFSSIAGGYPIRIDPSNKDHTKIMKSFKSMLTSLQYTLPCKWCRESHKKHMKVLPIEQFMGSRKRLMEWLYLIHDMVNKKLIDQQRECYTRHKATLIKKHLPKDQLNAKLRTLKSKILITKPSPPFESVLRRYEHQRAGNGKSICH